MKVSFRSLLNRYSLAGKECFTLMLLNPRSPFPSLCALSFALCVFSVLESKHRRRLESIKKAVTRDGHTKRRVKAKWNVNIALVLAVMMMIVVLVHPKVHVPFSKKANLIPD